ncbi:MAG: metallophosphoesterase [Bacillota bacterium]|nr:metallophosphoesterase [Bacillota bacterium]
MSVFAVGDLHLSFFPGADKSMAVFGPRWENHEERLKRFWEETVRPSDTVVICGDISWGLKLENARWDLDWIDALPGKKILLKGNHDLWWNGIGRLNRMYEGIRFLQHDCALAEDLCVCGSRGWLTPEHDDFTEADEKIYRREALRLEMSLRRGQKEIRERGGGKLVGVLHYPPASDRGAFTEFERLFLRYGVEDVYYGHIHGEDGFRSALQGEIHGVRYHLVSLDYLNCRLLKINR